MSVHTEPLPQSAGAERRVQVWDAFVRIFHWSVVIAFFVAYLSEDDLLTVHVWAGYTIGALVVLRIAWGFVGHEHARFSDFVTGPWRALRYLLDLVAGRGKRHVGHSSGLIRTRLYAAWVKVNVQPTRLMPRCFVFRIGPTVFPHPNTCSTHFRFL